MSTIKEQINTSLSSIRRALQDVDQGGRLAHASSEERCNRLWSVLSGVLNTLQAHRANPEIEQALQVLHRCDARFQDTLHARGKSLSWDYWSSRMNDSITVAMDFLEHACDVLEQRQESTDLSKQDEFAIRRAVWSAFVSSGGQKAQCPYPVGHAHREIWVDELAILAKEHHQKILEQTPPPAPIPEPLDMGEALRVFCSLPMGNESGGEIIDMPALDETKSLSALSNAH